MSRWLCKSLVASSVLLHVRQYHHVGATSALICPSWRHLRFNLSTFASLVLLIVHVCIHSSFIFVHACVTRASLVRHSRRLKASQSRDQAFCYADNFCREKYSKAKDNNNNKSKTATFNISVALRLSV